MNAERVAQISIVDVTKTFRLGISRKKTAVSHLTLDVDKGMVLGLLGPNGSGKSTTLKMLLGFLRPTEGEIWVCGYPAEKRIARSFLGYLPENPRFQRFLSGYDTLFYYGKLLGIDTDTLKKRIEELLDRVNLSHAAKERVHGYSKGMTQRLAIAQALLNRPPILVFDEPMSGLDPVGRIEIRRLIQQVHHDFPDTTIFFSTHILSDVEQLCTHVALLKQGQLATYCSLDQLLLNNRERYEVTVHHENPEIEERLSRENNGKRSPAGVTVDIDSVDELLQGLEKYRNLGAKVVGVSPHRRSLEEALFTERTSPQVDRPAAKTGGMPEVTP